MKVIARRFEHWLDDVWPVEGPDDLVWLKDRHDRIVGLDRTTGVRRVDKQASKDSGGPELDYDRGLIVWHGARPREVKLPAALPARSTYLYRAGDDVWAVHQPKRGKVKTRLARVRPGDTKVVEMSELDVTVSSNAAFAGDYVAVHDETRRVLRVFRGGEPVFEVPSRECGYRSNLDARGADVVIVGHQLPADGHVLVVITVMAIADGSRRRTFGLRARGATNVMFTDQDLIVFQNSDVLLISRANLAAAPSEEVELVIEDVATPAPAATATAQVTMVGATTGISFAMSAGKRKRLAPGGGPSVTVGETIAIDDEEAQVINRWHQLVQDAAPLAPGKRCFEPVGWNQLAVLLTTAQPVLDFDREDAEAAAAEVARAPDPKARFRTSMNFDATLYDDDEDDSEIEDATTLRSLHGIRERSSDVLDILFEDEIDPKLKLVAVIPILRFDDARKDLRFSFEFYSNAKPTATHRTAMRAAAERLTEGGWGNNYEFELPFDIRGCRVSIGPIRED